MDCLFCAILEGRESARIIHEDSHFLVLMDRYPLRPGHLLIVSREHAARLEDLSSAARDRLLVLADGISRVLTRAGYGIEGINLLLNDGPAANQHVPHLHLHLIPRKHGDLPALLGRILTRFLPFGQRKLAVRLDREAELLRQTLKEVFGGV